MLGGVRFGVGSSLLNWSFHFEKAARLTLIKFLQIVYGFLFDVFLFESKLRWTDYVGASLITSGVILVSMLKCVGVSK